MGMVNIAWQNVVGLSKILLTKMVRVAEWLAIFVLDTWHRFFVLSNLMVGNFGHRGGYNFRQKPAYIPLFRYNICKTKPLLLYYTRIHGSAL